jgi:hypothetical protein
VKFNIEIEKLLSDEEEPNQANLNPAKAQDGSTLSMRSLDFTSTSRNSENIMPDEQLLPSSKHGAKLNPDNTNSLAMMKNESDHILDTFPFKSLGTNPRAHVPRRL